jgi:hypothetical protein
MDGPIALFGMTQNAHLLFVPLKLFSDSAKHSKVFSFFFVLYLKSTFPHRKKDSFIN